MEEMLYVFNSHWPQWASNVPELRHAAGWGGLTSPHARFLSHARPVPSAHITPGFLTHVRPEIAPPERGHHTTNIRSGKGGGERTPVRGPLPAPPYAWEKTTHDAHVPGVGTTHDVTRPRSWLARLPRHTGNVRFDPFLHL